MKIKSDDPDLFYNKAITLDNLGKHKEALECYNRSLNLNPCNFDALNNKGISLVEMNRHQDAIECFDIVLSVNPKNSQAVYNKACEKSNLDEL